MPQRVLGRGQPGGRITAEEGQRAESALDRHAQPVVDDDAAWLPRVGDAGTGRCIAELRCPALRRRNDSTIAAFEEASVGKRLQDRDRSRVTERAQRCNRLFLLGEAVAGETSDKCREIVSPCERRCREQDEQARDKSYEENPHPLSYLSRSAQGVGLAGKDLARLART